MGKQRNRWVGPLLGLGAIIVVVAIYMMVTMPSKDVDMPADDASPEQVVASYVKALESHDCETAEALVSVANRVRTDVWCRDVSRVADVQVHRHVVEPTELSRATSAASSKDPAGGTEVVRVPVTFDVGWKLLSPDNSLPEGATDWGYLLTRESPAGPWRVFQEGTS